MVVVWVVGVKGARVHGGNSQTLERGEGIEERRGRLPAAEEERTPRAARGDA